MNEQTIFMYKIIIKSFEGLQIYGFSAISRDSVTTFVTTTWNQMFVGFWISRDSNLSNLLFGIYIHE